MPDLTYFNAKKKQSMFSPTTGNKAEQIGFPSAAGQVSVLPSSSPEAWEEAVGCPPHASGNPNSLERHRTGTDSVLTTEPVFGFGGSQG